MQLCYAWKSGVYGYIRLVCAHAPLKRTLRTGSHEQPISTANRVSHQQVVCLAIFWGKCVLFNQSYLQRRSGL